MSESKNIAVHQPGLVSPTYTDEQIQLIRDTIAKGATTEEFQLFMYRVKNMGLDPLKPGRVHFVKYGNNPGTTIVGIDGFRETAGRTGKHTGTKRGLLFDKTGKCIGAWAEVYRSDWMHPARDEVDMAEYNTGKAMWAKMPRTMIKKVAEVSALRMAFPDDLGGLYSDDEMELKEVKPIPAQVITSALPTGNPSPVIEAHTPSYPQPDARKIFERMKQTAKDKNLSDAAVAALRKKHFPTSASVMDLDALGIETFLEILKNTPSVPKVGSPEDMALAMEEADFLENERD